MQVALLLCTMLLLVSFLLYASLMLITTILFLTSVLLYFCGCEFFATVLLFCELHVMFLIFCLSLSWSRFDAQLSNICEADARYLIVSLIILPCSFLFMSIFCFCSTFSAGNYLFASTALCTYFDIFSIINASSTATQYIALATIYINSWAFVILNVFMFIAVCLYLIIQQFIAFYGMNSVSAAYSNVVKSGLIKAFVLRSQKQVAQLQRSTAVRFFVKVKAPKKLGKRTLKTKKIMQ